MLFVEFEFPRRTNPHLPDMPIVYASDDFLKLTGSITFMLCKLIISLLSLQFTTNILASAVRI